MKKYKKHIIIALVAVVVLYFGWKMYKNYKSTQEPGNLDNSSPSTGTVTEGGISKSVTMDNNTVLKRGSKGDRVDWVQYYFNKYVAEKKKMTPLARDGIFGAKTEAAVKATLGKTSTTWTEYKAHVESKYA